jgi:curved DNA-binding protein CbpA
MKNYYYILGVHTYASIQEIKSAYRKLAIRLHPDKNNGDKFFEERFKDIKEAYETLSDNPGKSDYDIKLRLYSGGFNHDELKKYKEILKKKYKDELKKREEDIKKKYRALEQNLKEEAEKRKKREEAGKTAEESKRKAEKNRMLNEIEGHKRLLAQKDQKIISMQQKLSATESEIIKARKDMSVLISKTNKYKAGGGDKRVPVFFLQEHPEILKELAKIKRLLSPKDSITFLKMVLQYAETRSLSSKYGRDHPHLVKLILKDTVRMRPFKLFYTKYKNDPKTIGNLKCQLLIYFDHFPI